MTLVEKVRIIGWKEGYVAALQDIQEGSIPNITNAHAKQIMQAVEDRYKIHHQQKKEKKEK